MKDEAQVRHSADDNMVSVLGLGNNERIRSVAFRKWWIIGAASIVAVIVYIIFGLFGGSPSPVYRMAEVETGEIVATVTATGTLEPVNSVDIGSEVSGQIEQVFVDFNDRVIEGQILAVLDTDSLGAQVLQTRASLLAAKARVQDAKATVAETSDKLERSRELAKTGYASKQSVDSAEASFARAEASLTNAEAQVAVSEASLSSAETAFSKSEIKSPINGVVLLRSVEPGQVVAASFNTPVLFTLAEDLTKMQLEIDVDEADIGQIGESQRANFVVDAFQNRQYPATITQVRFAPKTVDNVVTYQAILTVNNEDLSLRPGMTATATIVIAERQDALSVPNAALRFNPSVAQNKGRPRGPPWARFMDEPRLPPIDKSKKADDHEVWIIQDGGPQKVGVTIGISDGLRTEIISGNIKMGDLVVTGTQALAP
ncbi:MAG TPA: efflux RND transporter periplasmic adaptor subunit [Rhodospirillaceae bacterium]|nr:efflux transporter periplasmic adaptor subunit [Candidatus Neomarinimicrobiota bacterium]HCX14250.1 efflux RND transporter periplasmic adaptor subunit [Rhodospirillaceae bacterium]